jgi:hypothetical protein
VFAIWVRNRTFYSASVIHTVPIVPSVSSSRRLPDSCINRVVECGRTTYVICVFQDGNSGHFFKCFAVSYR